MKKFVLVILIILSIVTFTYSKDNTQLIGMESNKIEEIEDTLFSDKDLQMLKVPEIKLSDLYNNFLSQEKEITELKNKILLLEEENISNREKISELQVEIQKNLGMFQLLESKVDAFSERINELVGENKDFSEKGFQSTMGIIYKIGVILGLIIVGVVILLIGIVLYQSGRNKRQIEEWKEFFEINVERIKRDVGTQEQELNLKK